LGFVGGLEIGELVMAGGRFGGMTKVLPGGGHEVSGRPGGKGGAGRVGEAELQAAAASHDADQLRRGSRGEGGVGSTVVALVLADLLPDRREEILAVGRDLGWHRVWIARHYPTDIYAGRVLAQAIVRELKSSPAFQRDFAQLKSEIERAKRGQKETAASLWPAAAN